MSRSRTKGSTDDENDYWNKRFQVALTDVEISRREALSILGAGALAVLAYFSSVPSISNEQFVTTSEDTQTVDTEETQTEETQEVETSTTAQGGGRYSPASMSIFATGTVDTAQLSRHFETRVD